MRSRANSHLEFAWSMHVLSGVSKIVFNSLNFMTSVQSEIYITSMYGMHWINSRRSTPALHFFFV